eukprot:6198854-Amphidinium_carterae.2
MHIRSSGCASMLMPLVLPLQDHLFQVRARVGRKHGTVLLGPSLQGSELSNCNAARLPFRSLSAERGHLVRQYLERGAAPQDLPLEGFPQVR